MIVELLGWLFKPLLKWARRRPTEPLTPEVHMQVRDRVGNIATVHEVHEHWIVYTLDGNPQRYTRSRRDFCKQYNHTKP